MAKSGAILAGFHHEVRKLIKPGVSSWEIEKLARRYYKEHDAIADPVYADRVAELRAALVAELAGREEGFVCDGRLVPGRPLTNMLEHSA